MIKIFSKTGLLLCMMACIVSSTSCKKTLELDEIGGFPSDQAITTDADIAALLNSAHFAFAADDYYGGSFQVYNELLADHLTGVNLGGNYLGMFNRNTNIFNADNSSFYAQMSKPVLQANLVIDNLTIANEGNRDNYEGQARFMRALAFFDLVRMYAQPYSASTAASTPGIPMRLQSLRQPTARSSVDAVYTQIIADLKEAETLLPPTNGVNATSWAAKALLAKVYFQMNDFPNAYAYANDVIENGPFTFDSDIFNRFSTPGTPEAIFELINETNTPQNRFQRLRGNFNATGGGLPTLRLTEAFYDHAKSNTDDIRSAWYQERNEFFLLGKFDTAALRLPVIHLTEMKLIRAESAAENNTNLDDAIADLNDIIIRAYGPASSLILSGSAGAALIRDVARRERELEMVGEGNRLQELKRRGAKGESVMIRGAVYNCPGMIFPIPNNEVIYNQIAQNPTGGCN